MRIRETNRLLPGLCAALLASALVAAAAGAAELTVSGDLGISWLGADATGTNTFAPATTSGDGVDETPVFGAALGVQLPLSQALPWQVALPGRRGAFSFPDWPLRFEVEYLQRSDAELATPGVNAAQPYRADVESWSVMGKLRMDLPVRRAVNRVAGRVPFLDPLSLYLGGGAGIASSELDVSDSVIFGSDSTFELAWQAFAGFGYELSERVRWSVGWRYADFGRAKTRLVDSTGTDRGRYAADLDAHEFTTSLTFAFWRLSFLDD